MEIDAAISRSQEVLDNIAKIKGENYAKIVKHSLGLNLLTLICKDKFLLDMMVKSTSAIMADLAIAYGFDIKDPKEVAELRNNILAIMPNELKG